MSTGVSSLSPTRNPCSPTSRPATSLHSILKEHCRSRLYVPASLWTQQHVQLLGFQFQLRELSEEAEKTAKTQNSTPLTPVGADIPTETACSKPNPSHKRCRLEPSAAVEPAFSSVYRLHHMDASTRKPSLKKLLSDCGLQDVTRCPGSIDLCFNKEIVNTIQSKGVFTWGPAAPRSHAIYKPRCAYLKRRHRLQTVRVKENPYLVAVLIALAQRQRFLARLRSHDGVSDAVLDQQGETAISSQPQVAPDISKCRLDGDTAAQHDESEYTVYIILDMGATAGVVYIYTARIPGTLLDMFDYPRQSFPAPAVEVSYYKLPLSTPPVGT